MLAWSDDGLPIEFEADIASYIGKLVPLKRQKIAELLQIDKNVADDQIGRRIARALATVPFEAAVKALAAMFSVEPEDAAELLRITAALNLHPNAVEVVRRTRTREAHRLGAWLNCRCPLVPALFVHRAHYDDYQGLWRKKMVEVELVGREPSARDVIEYVRKKKSTGTTAKSPNFEAWLKQQDFCLVLPYLSQDDLEEVSKAFEKARLLVVTEDPIAEEEKARISAMEFVTPELSDTFEANLEAAFADFEVQENRS
jgi:hypothetical protein